MCAQTGGSKPEQVVVTGEVVVNGLNGWSEINMGGRDASGRYPITKKKSE